MRGLVIAVVNDDADFLEFMEAALSDEGARVLTHDGFDGSADMIQHERPHLAILDMGMGFLNAGLEVLNQLRQRPETVDIPVIIASGDIPYLRQIAPMLHAQGVDTLEKPFTLDELRTKIEQVAGS